MLWKRKERRKWVVGNLLQNSLFNWYSEWMRNTIQKDTRESNPVFIIFFSLLTFFTRFALSLLLWIAQRQRRKQEDKFYSEWMWKTTKIRVRIQCIKYSGWMLSKRSISSKDGSKVITERSEFERLFQIKCIAKSKTDAARKIRRSVWKCTCILLSYVYI